MRRPVTRPKKRRGKCTTSFKRKRCRWPIDCRCRRRRGKLSGIGLTRLREAIGDRTLIAHKHGTRTVILPDDLKAWLKALPLAGDEKKDRPN